MRGSEDMTGVRRREEEDAPHQGAVAPRGCGSCRVPWAWKEGDVKHAGVVFSLLPLLLLALGEDLPEEAFAAFASHSVEVKACGPVSAHPADSRYIPVKVARVRQGSAGRHRLHPCKNSSQAGVRARASWHPLHPPSPICQGAQQSWAAPQGPGLSRISLLPLRHDSPYPSLLS